MSDTDVVEPDTPEADEESIEEEEGRQKRRTRVISREGLLMLVVPPILIALGFLGYVVWRMNATLDSAERSQLAWGEVLDLTWQHIGLTFVSAALVILIAVPLGIMLTRSGLDRVASPVVAFANAGQAAPTIGLIVLLFLLLGGGFWTAVLALTIYGILPVLRNTITGLQGVDDSLIEAGRGMGMTSRSVLGRVELPLALPVIMAGVRTSLVLVCGTASLAFLIAGGGLGVILNTGLTLQRFPLMVVGALLIALLALTIEWLGRVAEYVLRPKGV